MPYFEAKKKKLCADIKICKFFNEIKLSAKLNIFNSSDCLSINLKIFALGMRYLLQYLLLVLSISSQKRVNIFSLNNGLSLLFS